MKTAEIRKYAEAWRQREEREFNELEALRRKALLVAGKAVRILVRDFKIKKAVLFGSVLVPGRFHKGSDIDIAIEGLKPALFFKACGQMMTDFDFEIDLKPVEDLKGLIRERVSQGRVIYEKR
jgi:predicted nucleotidyltransferase